MTRKALFALCLMLITALVAVSGCAPEEEPKLDPKVSPPAIAKQGTLRAGVDLKTPPFGGVDGTTKAGIDVDVAAALAEKLGLIIEYVDVAPSEAASALAQGKVDVVFSMQAGSDLSRMTVAGTYVNDAAGLFIATDSTGSVEPSLTIDTLPASAIAVQSESESYWRLRSELGSEAVKPFDSLREAFDAVSRGDVSVAAGDAIVGAYLLRDFPTLQFAGQIGDAYPLAAVVAAENTALSDAVRSALDELASDGVLDSIRDKWVGGLPPLTVPEESDAAQQ